MKADNRGRTLAAHGVQPTFLPSQNFWGPQLGCCQAKFSGQKVDKQEGNGCPWERRDLQPMCTQKQIHNLKI